MIIELLRPNHDLACFVKLRSDALQTHPPAFGQSPEEFSLLPEETCKDRLSDNGRGDFVLGARLVGGGDLVGMAGVYHERGKRFAHRANVWGVYVREDHRGQGLGKALMKALIEKVERQKSAEILLLTVVTDNHSAVRMYEQLGFKVYGTDARAMKVSGVYYDEYLMRRQLQWKNI